MRTWFPALMLAVTACDDGGGSKNQTPWGVDLGDPQDWIDPLEYHLAAATTAAWLGQIGAAWVADGAHPCAADPGDGTLVLTPGADCPHALLPDLAGTAVLTLPTGADPIFSADASGLEVGGRTLVAQQFPMVQAAATGATLDVVLSTADYGEETLWTWVVHVDTAGTPELTDDTIELYGADTAPQDLPSRYADGGNQVSLLLEGYRFEPTCRANPTAGRAVVEGSTFWPLFDVQAHTDCDGRFSIDSTAQEDEWTPSLDLLTP